MVPINLRTLLQPAENRTISVLSGNPPPHYPQPLVDHIISKDDGSKSFKSACICNSRDMKQPKCPSTHEQVKKIWYIYTREYDSAINRNKTGLSILMWTDLESVIQSEVGQKREKRRCILTSSWNLEKWCR